jgi:hypothetical protein
MTFEPPMCTATQIKLPQNGRVAEFDGRTAGVGGKLEVPFFGGTFGALLP